ncbi:MAG: glycosyltransferase [Clostridium sp.]|uniref:glycosyltransferase family 2 protein n=1 Tax=Clostridium sp. TaxID=1506 RepID=UPI00304E9030
MKPKISVIVPIYNVEQYLSKCIDSLINQSLKCIEIILIDDGSTDESGVIADEYSRIDNRIVVIHQENSGQGVARNKGIDIAAGEYIGFVDSDDWIDSDMYEKLYYLAISNCADIGVCSRKIYDENGVIGSIRYVEEEEVIEISSDFVSYTINHLFYPHTVSSCNKIYNRSLIENSKIRFKNVKEVGSEDALFNYCILLNSNKIITVKNVFYNGLERVGSTTREYKEGAMKRTANLIKYIYQYSNKVNKKEVAYYTAPLMLLFFQQWNYNYIKTFGSNSLRENIIKEHKMLRYEKYFKYAEKELVINRKLKKYLKMMGYSWKGIMFIKLYMIFSYLNIYSFAAKIRTAI